MINHSYTKYKTKPLEKVLKETFSVSEQPLFGGQHTHSRSSVRTAVTSTKETGEKAVLLTNYNRSREEDDQCRCLVGYLAFFAKDFQQPIIGLSGQNYQVTSSMYGRRECLL